MFRIDSQLNEGQTILRDRNSRVESLSDEIGMWVLTKSCLYYRANSIENVNKQNV